MNDSPAYDDLVLINYCHNFIVNILDMTCFFFGYGFYIFLDHTAAVCLSYFDK